MDRVMNWLQTNEQKVLMWANRRRVHKGMGRWMDRWLSAVTHMGGATFTLASAILCVIFAPNPWHTAGWQCAAAVAASHIPVAVIKRKYRRLRPHQAIPHVQTGRKPLCDSSFPSGHTTAIFAWLTPWLIVDTALLPALLPMAIVLGVSVAWSRMYLGLHYPSDVAAGALLGSLTSLAVSAFWSLS